MVEDTSTHLTEDETEIYDRQIRLWGIDSQKRIRNARVIVIGLDGLGAEIVKNLVLSGVKSILLHDDKDCTVLDTYNQFLIPAEHMGQNRAVSSRLRAQNLNPLVDVKADNQPLSEKPDSFLHDFEVVISCSQDLDLNLRLDRICRNQGIPFIAGGVYGTYGYIFYDYKEHEYAAEYTSSKKGAETKKVFEKVTYPAMEDVFNIDFSDPKIIKPFLRFPPTFFLLKVLYKFRSEFGRDPTNNDEDLSALMKFRDEIMDGIPYPKQNFPDILFRCICVGQLSPCCAIVGAIASQEVIKVVSKKDKPHNNFFFFNPFSLSGFTQTIVPN